MANPSQKRFLLLNWFWTCHQIVPKRFRVSQTMFQSHGIPPKEFSRMSCTSPTWHWRQMWSHRAYWIGRTILLIFLGVHGTADWMKCGKATVLGVSPKAIPWVKGPKESCLPAVFWSQTRATTRKYPRRCWMLVLPDICCFGFPQLQSNLRSGSKLMKICNLDLGLHYSSQSRFFLVEIVAFENMPIWNNHGISLFRYTYIDRPNANIFFNLWW